jgi:hypothetical protein
LRWYKFIQKWETNIVHASQVCLWNDISISRSVESRVKTLHGVHALVKAHGSARTEIIFPVEGSINPRDRRDIVSHMVEKPGNEKMTRQTDKMK